MTLQFVRPVDNLERYNITRSNVNVYNNVAVGVSLLSSISLPSLQQRNWAQLLFHPIIALIDRHPILATVIGDYLTGHPAFLRLDSFDLLRLIRVVGVDAPTMANSSRGTYIERVLEDEHNKPFDLADHTVPLWRLVVVVPHGTNTFDIIYTFHHVIGDGRSAMALTEQLVQQLNLQLFSQASNNDATTSTLLSFKISIESNKPIPASIESRINCYPSIRTLLWEASRALFLPGFLKKALESKYWAGEIDSSLEFPNVTQVGFLRLSREETRAVVQLAKSRGTTVQAIMYTASIFAVRSIFLVYKENDKNQEGIEVWRENKEALVFATPCSLRRLIPGPQQQQQQLIEDDEQGNFVSEILHENIQVRDGSGFWAMTDEYRKQVVTGTTTTSGVRNLLEHFGALALLSKKDGEWEKFMASRVTKDQHGRKASIKLSNLGRGWEHSTVGTSQHDQAELGYTVQDVLFSQSSGVTASALTMSAATANGRLSISTTWQMAGFRGRERGEAFVAEFKRILLNVALHYANAPELTYLDICPRE
ncbi:hypothetical protein FBU30_003664 [Linnemannia zychae]|nr:hypothetical protein FBU30_003664 [Linnemannia zychae]